MSEKMSRAEEAYVDGLANSEIALRSGGAKPVQQRAVELFQEALNLGLDGSTEIHCRLALGIELLDLYREQFNDLGNSGLENLPELKTAVTELERAFILDAQRGTKVFNDRTAQSMALLRLSAIWQQQSFYVKNQFGLEKKLEYLQEKLKLLEYLGGVKPSGLCNSLAFYYKDVGNRPLTLEWLKNGAETDVYEDISSRTRLD